MTYQRYTIFLLVAFFAFFTGCENKPEQSNANTLQPIDVNYPETKKQDVKDNYHGTEVQDPYRWLEDDNSPETKAWVQAQNEVTFGYLNQIPFREDIRERLTSLYNYARYKAPTRHGDYYYYFKNDGLQQQDVLYKTSDLQSEGEVILDPNKFSESGTVALGEVDFSKNGRYLGYSVSVSGSDWREIYILDTETGKNLEDTVKWVKFSGIAWKDNGFYYSRYPAPAEGEKLSGKNQYHAVYYHELGTSQSEDHLVYEDKENPLRSHYARVTDNGRFLIILGSQGTSGNNILVKDLAQPNGKLVKVLDHFENDHSVVGSIESEIYLLTTLNAPNKRLVKFTLDNPNPEAWETVIPEQEKLLSKASLVGGKIITHYLENAYSTLYQYDVSGKLEKEIALPGIGSVSGFDGSFEDGETFYSFTSFTVPTDIYRYDVSTGNTGRIFSSEVDFEADKYVTEQVFYESKDGTKVPMFIVYKKGLKRDGSSPTWLYSYGGFDISMRPTFRVDKLVWLENGGIYAQPSIRGGGEYGQKWHEGGMKLNKQNVFDDFIAAAEYLIDQKFTNKDKLAIQGGSNGGLLVGACMTQRPDLFQVALPAVGVMDMLRYHKFTIGWAWAVEYGSSEDSIHFRNLLTYSPLHNLKEGTEYPATMVTTADHDDRVVPAHSFKFAAALQEKHAGENPVLIRIATDAGHGAGKPTSMKIEEAADLFAFTWYNMGVVPDLANQKNKKTAEVQ